MHQWIILCLVSEVNLHRCCVRMWNLLRILSSEKEHWNVLIIECKSLSSNWEKVSAYLGLSFELIETINRDNPRDSAGCWNEALKEWIRQNYNTKTFGQPSWRSLLRAVAEVDKHQFQKLAAEHQGEKTKKNYHLIYYCWWHLNTGTGDKHQERKEYAETTSGEAQTSSSDSRGLLLGLNYTLSVSIFIIIT